MKTILLILLPTLFAVNLYSQQCFNAEKEGIDGYVFDLKFTTGDFDFEAPKNFKGILEFDGGFDEIEITTLTEKKRTVLEKSESPDDEEVIEIIFDESYADMPDEKNELKFVFTVSPVNGVILNIEKADATYGKISFDNVDCPE